MQLVSTTSSKEGTAILDAQVTTEGAEIVDFLTMILVFAATMSLPLPCKRTNEDSTREFETLMTTFDEEDNW